MGFRSPYDPSAGMPSVRPADTPEPASPRVVFVGADPADVRLARNVFEEDAGVDLRVVPDVSHAISLIGGRPPALVVIDLDLNGGAAELVATVRANAKLSGVPMIVLTNEEEDVNEAYRVGASCVMARPESLDGFFDAMRAIQRFWLESAELPRA